MTFTKIASTSIAALFLGMTAANAAMVLRQDANGNKVVVNTNTEDEARLYGNAGAAQRPDDCEAGGFWMMDHDGDEVYVSCDDPETMYMAGDPATTAANGMQEGDRQLEPYAPGTEGVNN